MAIIPNTTDTIAALATPAGSGAIAVLRLSGKDAFTICDKIFSFSKKKNKKISDQKSHTLHLGFIKSGAKDIDEVLVSVFRAPASYTGENVIEISCHGSTFVQQKILETMVAAGARLAQPGEFTLRAFLNGKLDLAQAEAVADLIAADNASAHHLAMQQMRGGFSGEINKLRDQLIHFASLLELELDFAEEDVEFANRNQLKKLINDLISHISHLISSFELGNVIRNGIPVVIAGKPNAGKSTLLNALLNEERAIVTDIAGTTRDTIEERINIGGVSFRFIDTAGIRSATDLIESIGVARTYKKMDEAAAIVYLFDPQETSYPELKETIAGLNDKKTGKKATVIPVANKIDRWDIEKLKKDFPSKEIIFISAKEKSNIELLTTGLLQLVQKDTINLNDAIVTNARHVDALTKANEALAKAFEALNTSVTTDLIASDIRVALYYLGEITGEITSDNLLENIFSKFCIGK